jgi:hypothetical protein
MTADLAGFGIPDFLPLATRRALAAAERAEAREAREAEAERDQRLEAKRNSAMALYAVQAEARGEHVSAMAIVTGQAGRTLGEIFATAEVMASREDTRREVMDRRSDGDRPFEVCLAEVPVTRSAPESPEGRQIINTVRHYAIEHPDSGVIDRAIVASEARKAQRRDRPVIPPRREAVRSAAGYQEITRVCTAAGNVAWEPS